MPTISGIFASPDDAEATLETLQARGFDQSRISLLRAGDVRFATPVTAKTAGATIGGVLAAGASTFLIPGLGPIAGFGMLAASLAGVGLGAAAGAAVDRHTKGIPNEQLFFYEETLREGGAVVFVEAENASQETRARNLLEQAGARSPDAVRRQWWQGVRSNERDFARGRGIDFDGSEGDYRAGFEAALHPATRGRSLDECLAYVETCYPEPCRTEMFRLGFGRGQEYLHRGRLTGAEVH
jgi:hypothetical protein